MNSIYLIVISFFLFYLGYRFYGSFIEKIFDINPNRKVPACENYDGRDYVPARHWLLLFGHHFASIAGAGPIIGPVIAAQIWGWLPCLIWIVIGCIVIGAVHDFSSLMISVRHGGKSIADISKSLLGQRWKIMFAIFLWLALVLVIAVFASAAATTLWKTPQVVIPTFGVIIVAMFVGWLIYNLKVNIILATLIGISSLAGLIVLGYHYPITVPNPFYFWLFILLGYAFFASIIPVNILLQPRDYISTFVLIFGLIFGYIGLFITHPVMHTPMFIKFSSEGGSWLWPMMCVTIACGAISGFHSLIASGTTSKQLPNEIYAKRIGYGGMIAEGLLALLALLAVVAGLYWVGAPKEMIYPVLIKEKGWIATFGKGYGAITLPIFGGLGALIGITMLKTFIMTTLDSATRITRYIGKELFGEGLGLKFMENIYLNTAIVIGVALWLSIGNWKAIWPVFGTANQLMAAIALFLVFIWLSSAKKRGGYFLFPFIFMLFTTTCALLWQAFHFFPEGKILLGVISCVLLILAVFMISEIIKTGGKVKAA